MKFPLLVLLAAGALSGMLCPLFIYLSVLYFDELFFLISNPYVIVSIFCKPDLLSETQAFAADTCHVYLGLRSINTAMASLIRNQLFS